MVRDRLDRKREKQFKALENHRKRLILSDNDILKTAKRFRHLETFNNTTLELKKYRKSIEKEIKILEDKGVR